MASKFLNLNISNHPGLLRHFWSHGNICLLAASSSKTFQKRHFGAFQKKTLSNGSSVFSSDRSHKIYGSQFSSESFKAKVKDLFKIRFNLEYLQSQQRNIGNSSASSLNFSVLSKKLSFKSLFSTPFPFLVYGVFGLTPFISVPGYMYWTNSYCPSLAFGQLVYGACILSFLGGVSWGNEMVHAKKVTLSSLYYSVLLPLIAWPAVLLYPYSLSFLVMIGGISYAGYKDILNPKYPEWFVNLRFLLSTLVACALATTLILYWTKDVESINKKQELKASSQ